MRSAEDKTVVITGGGRGIGKRFAIGFARAGAKVGLVSRTGGELEATRLEIDHAGGQAFPACADVRDWKQIREAMRRIARKYGPVDALIASAAVQGPIGPFSSSDPAAWDDVVRTNLLGVMHAVRAVLPSMMERRSGKIIVVTGGGTVSARPFFSPYAASKAALARLVESIAHEVRDHNVQINCFSPGGSYTSMTDEILSAGDKAGAAEIHEAQQVRMTGGVPAERQLAFALFLASTGSNHITGKIVHVNDDLKRLEQTNMTPDSYTLRRHRS